MVKVGCPNCGCFVVMEDESFVMPEVLPEPSDGCDRKTCPCHTGIGLMPRFHVTSKQGVSAAQYMMENYSRTDVEHL